MATVGIKGLSNANAPMSVASKLNGAMTVLQTGQ